MAPPEITPEAIAGAESLLGLRFSDEERKQMRAALSLVAHGYEQTRALDLPNELGPALRFDPLPPGASPPGGESTLVRSAEDPGGLPNADEDIAHAPVSRLSRWIESGALSATRLTEIYLERLARLGPGLECVILVCEERARAEARRADDEISKGRYRGPLHGIPWGAKDLLDTAGIGTTYGATPYRKRVPEHDAEIVRRLGVAGAVLVAKLSLGELAMGDTWFGGRTRNPWSPAQGSGGSSAGPAAATAAGLVGFSIGSETLGSIGNPCMICGTTGLRPTFGRVARSGAMALCWSLDKLGPICRSVEDAALVLAATQGAHAGDPDSRDAALHFDVRRSARGRRIGFVPEQFDAEETTDVERAALDTLRADGAELCELELPDLPYEGVFVLVWVEAAAAFQSLLTRGQLGELRGQEGSSWPNLFRAAHLVSAVEYVQLLRVRTRVMRETAALFANVDAIVAPDMGSRFHLVTNVTGHPSLTLRAGFRPDGTPASVTLHGQLFGDGALLEIGRALESRLGVWERRPPGTSP